MPSRRWPANLSPRCVACSHAVTRRSRTAFPNAPTTYLSSIPPPSHEHTLCRRPPRLPREQPQLAGSIRRPRATFLQFLPPAAPQPPYSRSPPPLIVPEPLRRGQSQNFRPPYHVRVRSTSPVTMPFRPSSSPTNGTNRTTVRSRCLCFRPLIVLALFPRMFP
jgi:hypothetical protein